MGQRATKKHKVHDHLPSSPPKPCSTTGDLHPRPREEGPAGAVNGVGENEKRKRKGFLKRLTSVFKAAKSQHPESISCQQQEKREEREVKVAWAPKSSDDYIFSRYSVGDELGKGGFGIVYEGRRLDDGLKVAVKYVRKTKHNKCVILPDHRNPIPKEIALTILVNRGSSAPEIIGLLDWQDRPDHFVLVLERPSPCETLTNFMKSHGGRLNEEKTRKIMRQVVNAANICCNRGVFHRDIKLSNLLINRETFEVKLIDFGCGNILRRSSFRSYSGTPIYCPPEFFTQGKYHGRPATVWSLGVLMFRMLCGGFPLDFDLFLLQNKLWSRPELSKECSDLLRALLHRNPHQRLRLEQIQSHNWFEGVT